MSKVWSSTLKLPKSTFPPRTAPDLRPLYLQRSTDEFYAWQQANRPATKPFVVHDGPPYANGKLHVGHALNKILKDFSLRVKVQQGHRVQYRPGWDCHGLPIELKALEALAAAESGSSSSSASSSASSLSALDIRQAARKLARRTIVDQMREFRSFGVMADWDRRWTTMDADYEMRQLRLFQQLVHKGLIYRRYKPVYWSPSSHTALAEAELEYNDKHVSTAVFVKLPVVAASLSSSRLAGKLAGKLAGPLSALIWTTTPWTLPANQAISVHRELDYAVVQLTNAASGARDAVLVAESCLENVGKFCSPPHVLVGSIPGADLLGLAYTNPLQGSQAQPQPFIHADFVAAGSGSGLVHTAPGHGFEDYEVCKAYDIPVPAPVDGEGKFTAEAYPDDPAKLEGLPVQGEGEKAVVAILRDAVVGLHKFQHKYPYDWRTKKPIIVRATAQWFADVAEIKEHAVASLDGVRFVPEAGRSRLESFVQGRSEWCISRQRAWGVPIPALCGDDGSVVLTEQTVEHILSVVKERGTDAWWSDAPDDPAWIPDTLRQAGGVTYTRGTDTMDVWFDSGSSWTQVADQAQVDVYLEGSDQHRGWFQSSLLTRVAALGASASSEEPTDPNEAGQSGNPGNLGHPGHPGNPGNPGTPRDVQTLSPFKTLVTHGFMLDGEGKKMSKSLGNIVTGEEVMNGTLLPPLKPRKKKKGRGKKKEAEQPATEPATEPAAEPATGETATPEPAASAPPKYDALGSDALRLWVACSDYTGDVVMSQTVLQTTHTMLLRYRAVLKMLLGSLHEASRTAPLTALDHIAVLQLRDTMAEVAAANDKFEFYRGVAALNRWLANDFSAFYLEAAKDRLYCADGGGVLEAVFFGMTRMLAPLVPALVEEAWDHAPAWLKKEPMTTTTTTTTAAAAADHHPLHQLYDAPLLDGRRLPGDETRLRQAIPVIMEAHAAVKAASERARLDKALGSSLQCSVVLAVPDAAAPGRGASSPSAAPPSTLALLQDHADELATMFVVSSVSINAPVPEEGAVAWRYAAPFAVNGVAGTAWVLPPQQAKCVRCWRYVAEEEDHLCGRCEDVVAEQKAAEATNAE